VQSCNVPGQVIKKPRRSFLANYPSTIIFAPVARAKSSSVTGCSPAGRSWVSCQAKSRPRAARTRVAVRFAGWLAATGFGVAFTIGRKYVTSVLLLLAVAFCGWAINNSLWNDQIKKYGPDPSEAVLYYPPPACSGLALFTAMIVAAWATLKSRRLVA
jgi:hypothetical protein